MPPRTAQVIPHGSRPLERLVETGRWPVAAGPVLVVFRVMFVATGA
ncbi:MAG: hypothetical protein ACYC6J_01840 [Coriobacteriia bacterium]